MNRPTLELTVAVCTHNPRAAFLARTLAALRAQTLASERWELLLIDNASSPPVAPAWPLIWHHGRPDPGDARGPHRAAALRG